VTEGLDAAQRHDKSEGGRGLHHPLIPSSERRGKKTHTPPYFPSSERRGKKTHKPPLNSPPRKGEEFYITP